jgi:hypothetical protein
MTTKRHGTTTLFPALNILDGTVIGRNMRNHRHQGFIRLPNTIEEQVPKVRQWLARHTRWTFDFPRPQHPDPTRSKASPTSSRASASTRRFSICH